MSYTRRMFRSLLASFFILLFAWSAAATTVVPLSFEQLVNASHSVVYGRVAEVRSRWTDDRRFIESIVTIEILKGIKGAPGESIEFTIPGGQVGRYLNVIPGAPRFAPGDLGVFFLTAHGPRLPVTTGFTQGVYRVRRDANSGELIVMPPVVDSGRVVRGDLRRKPVSLSVFESSVRKVAAR